MTRPIKFRAWDKHEKKMYGVVDIPSLCAEARGQRIGMDLFIANPARFELGQFTGFLDKNGKEIYEGDILESKSLFNSSHSRKKNPYYEVVWGVCGWNVNGYNGDIKVSPQLDFKRDWEIIGNIHENSELLK